jgi:hypothetical protein
LESLYHDGVSIANGARRARDRFSLERPVSVAFPLDPASQPGKITRNFKRQGENESVPCLKLFLFRILLSTQRHVDPLISRQFV